MEPTQSPVKLRERTVEEKKAYFKGYNTALETVAQRLEMLAKDFRKMKQEPLV